MNTTLSTIFLALFVIISGIIINDKKADEKKKGYMILGTLIALIILNYIVNLAFLKQ